MTIAAAAPAAAPLVPDLSDGPVLGPAERAFFEENGYVVIPNAVPEENCAAVVRTIFAFTGMDPDDPETWYRPPAKPDGMIALYQHQSLWDNRQHPRAYQAFADLWGRPDLWVSLDRVNMKPPRREPIPEVPRKQGFGYCHWDFDTRQLAGRPLQIQGVLCLTDTSADMGGFQCVPGFHKPGLLEDWIAAQGPDRNPQMPDLTRLPPGMAVTPIPARAGDLILWNARLAHGNGHNRSHRPRLAQYIALRPVPPPGPDAEAKRADRVHRWRERLSPDEPWAAPDPRRWEQTHGKTAELTPLGRKLLGLDTW